MKVSKVLGIALWTTKHSSSCLAIVLVVTEQKFYTFLNNSSFQKRKLKILVL